MRKACFVSSVGDSQESTSQPPQTQQQASGHLTTKEPEKLTTKEQREL